MSRTLILVANIVLVATCCFLAARVIAAVSGSMLVPEAGAALSQPLPVPPTDRSWDARQIIISRNPFNASTLAPAAEPPDEEEEYAKTKLPLRLLGTAAHESTSLSWAAVEDLEARSHMVVRVGDRLKGRADVLRIERRRIVLQNGARREELALEGEGEGKSPRRRTARARPRPRPRARSRSPRVERLAENRFAVERSDVNEVANNPAALFSQARILPKYENGQMVGVQLNAIKAGSLFQEIGIQDGDTITEFNGIRVTGQQESAQVLSELTSAQTFAVTVKGRDGQIRQLEYEIR
ncbi:MAG: hypothetical protein JRH01_00935 [Deltaproteobacteria bacterium]|nr:hypothetical protein [Deltaproteobacteria bacterium]MBW2393607.1 hypothetical protein [Deltaproteobacteria bacterium]